jgi:hypothetical protein
MRIEFHQKFVTGAVSRVEPHCAWVIIVLPACGHVESDESVLCGGDKTRNEVRLLGSIECVNEKKIKDLWFMLFIPTFW